MTTTSRWSWALPVGDLRYAARSLRRSPGFASAAIVTIALGIGVNTGIFTVLNGLLFRDLPVANAHEVVSIYQTVEGVPDREGAFSAGLVATAEYEAYRDRTRTLSGLVAHSDPSRTILGGESPQEILGALVTCNFFDVLEQPPALGRALTPRDCESGADLVVVLGHELWLSAFAADPAIVGRTVELNRQLFSVVGVAAADTYGGFIYRTAYFAPFSAQPLLLPNENAYANVRNSWLFLLGRRAPGASLEQVRAELGVIAAQLDAEVSGRSTALRIERARPLSMPFLRDAALLGSGIVLAPFILVLLVACANVANLLLARATARSREIAVRLSLGASRARVVRQLLAESVLLSIAGGVLGSVLAIWTFQSLLAFALPAFSPVGIPPLVIDASPDVRVLVFTTMLTLATVVLFGLVPALHASRPNLTFVMKRGASEAGGRGGRFRGVLVGVQAAMCMVLMCAAGLLLRGLSATQTVDPGFVYEDVAVAAFDLQSAGYDPAEAAVFARQLRERVGALPGVEAVAYGIEPLSADKEAGPVRLPSQAEAESRFAQLNWVSPEYFSLIRIPLVRGRTFTDTELASEGGVVIVTEATARNYWPGQDPIGQTLIVGPQQVRVVGVARDAQVSNVGEVDPFYLYLPAEPRVQFLLKLLVRSRGDFAATAVAIQGAVRALDGGLWVRVEPLQANLDWARNLSRFVATLAAALGVLALTLAAVGIYGVVAYFVGRRSHELGVRMALGARAVDVFGLILRQTMRPVVVGAAIGVVAAVAVSRVLTSVLFGVEATDPLGLGGAMAIVLGVALAAGALAGRRAARIEPMRVLREE